MARGSGEIPTPDLVQIPGNLDLCGSIVDQEIFIDIVNVNFQLLIDLTKEKFNIDVTLPGVPPISLPGSPPITIPGLQPITNEISVKAPWLEYAWVAGRFPFVSPGSVHKAEGRIGGLSQVDIPQGPQVTIPGVDPWTITMQLIQVNIQVIIQQIPQLVTFSVHIPIFNPCIPPPLPPWGPLGTLQPPSTGEIPGMNPLGDGFMFVGGGPGGSVVGLGGPNPQPGGPPGVGGAIGAINDAIATLGGAIDSGGSGGTPCVPVVDFNDDTWIFTDGGAIRTSNGITQGGGGYSQVTKTFPDDYFSTCAFTRLKVIITYSIDFEFQDFGTNAFISVFTAGLINFVDQITDPFFPPKHAGATLEYTFDLPLASDYLTLGTQVTPSAHGNATITLDFFGLIP